MDQTCHLIQSQYTDSRPTSSVLILNHQMPGRVAARVPVFKSQVWLDQGKNGSIPESPICEADALPLDLKALSNRKLY